MVAMRLRKPGLGEQPRRSKMRWLKEWQVLLTMGAVEVFLASCAYGSPHQKEFCFVGAHMEVSLLHRPCTRDHHHVPIQGKYTKPSATYTDALASALGQFFKDHLVARERAMQRLDYEVGGLEDVITNDICCSLSWKEDDSWAWKGASHINLLETSATLKLYRKVAVEGGDCRFTYIGDSHVSRSAMARGRTSSGALRPLLKKSAALCLGFGLYPAGRFGPTRLNPGDAPSRQAEIQRATDHSICLGLNAEVLTALASLPPLKKWVSNWLRLALLIHPFLASLPSIRHELRTYPLSFIDDHEWLLEFDSTLGYPGEGWICLLLVTLISCWSEVATVGLTRSASHGDAVRRQARQGINLVAGRRVTETTAFNRDWLFGKFQQWLETKGFSVDDLLFQNPIDLDRLNNVLVEYGRWLFSEGKPYYHFSETLNSLTSRRPAVRRSIQQAWDLAFMWGSHEPSTHHVAMPFQVLIAVVSVALCWGWTREAATFALAWGALLRIGEIFQAKRIDLVLPSDVGGTIQFALLRIMEPKTRYRAARHQTGKLEQPDLLEVIRVGFAHLLPHEPLWPLSGSTLRLRLTRILSALNLPSKTGDRPKPLSLASFRPGGATWLITVSESAELVRRRGRWISNKIMECYLQEVTSMTYLNEVDPHAKQLRSGLFCFEKVPASTVPVRLVWVVWLAFEWLKRQQSHTTAYAAEKKWEAC